MMRANSYLCRSRDGGSARQTRMVQIPPCAPVGRGGLLAEARTILDAGGSVLLWGPTGIGKSTILDALATEPQRARVLRAAPAEAESKLPYLALVDLFGGVLDERPAGLPD